MAKDNSQKENIGRLIETETAKRLDAMAAPEYEFPAPLARIDIALIAAGILLSGVLIILCLTGVIR